MNKNYGTAILYELNQAKTKFRLTMQDPYVKTSMLGVNQYSFHLWMCMNVPKIINSLSLSLSLSTKRNLKGFKTEYGGLFSNEFHGIGNLSRQPDNYTMLSSFFVFLSRIYRTLPFAWRQTP